ncbi:hypothetical protein [Subtercola boreus]|uniref:hypothetical protein n=1 Tax=Subtercola boreus TaxID=120213 RepID=UPI001559E0E9|nr:hypothetical protein [Subtercola boreus]
MEDEAVATVKHDVVDGQLVEQLIGRTREQVLTLTGPGWPAGSADEMVLESASEGELIGHLGYGKHERAGDVSMARNGIRTKTVLTSIRGQVPGGGVAVVPSV